MKSIIIILALALGSLSLQAQKIETVPFGDFENWAVRYIKESGIIGGETRTMYMVAPKDTIRANKPFDYKNTIWTGSNAYAVVMGVTKVSNNVIPDKGPTGYCAKLETVVAKVKAVGVISISVVAAGSLFWGKTREPIRSADGAVANLDWGIPYAKRPKALVLDFKAVVPNTGKLAAGKSTIDGYDEEEIMLILQNRTEDASGNIHVKRVGTAIYHVNKSTGSWVRDYRIPVMYGDASKQSGYKDYMGLRGKESGMYAINRKGESKPLVEEGWASADTPVTHAILSLCTSSQGVFKAAIGNTLWVDNLRLEF